MKLLLSVSILFLAFSALAEVLPSDRFFTFAAGVQGDIPAYTNSANVLDYGADPTGQTNCYSAFTNAIAHATNLSAVYFPTGTYLLSNGLIITSKQVALRGDGPTNTVIISWVSSSSLGSIVFQGSGSSSNVVYSAAKGSTNILMVNTNGLTPGRWITIKESQDPAIVVGRMETAPPTPLQCQNVKIVSISGTNVTIDRPLNWNYTNQSLGLHVSQRSFQTNCGIENMTILSYSNTQRAVFFFDAANCWATNVVVTNANQIGFAGQICANITIRHCSVLKASGTSQRYGVMFSTISCDNLVEDNIFDGVSIGVALQDTSGTVVAYNFHYRGIDPNNLQYGLLCHGDFNNWNLFEGNVIEQMGCDNFWGCNTYNTFFRNWSKCQALNLLGNEVVNSMWAVELDATNYYNNFVGNILMSPRDIGGPFASRNICALGYQGESGSRLPPGDPQVTNTVFWHGNFDFINNVTGWSNGVSHDLTNSYYLASKPSWFGTLAWPPIGPDVNTNSTITNLMLIPAQARYQQIDYFTQPYVIPNVAFIGFETRRTDPVTTTFTLSADSAGTIAGNVSADGKFSIVSGSPYSITYPATATITLKYTPTVEGNDLGTVTITGGGGAIISLSGSSTNFPTKATTGTVLTIGKVQL